MKPAIFYLQGCSSRECWGGTAFAISGSGYLLTNEHNIREKSTGERLDWVMVNLLGSTEKHVAHVVHWNEDYDVAILKADYQPRAFFRVNPNPPVQEGDEINVYGAPDHIQGYLMKGYVGHIGNLDIYHSALTFGGASGSPIFLNDGTLVGIHKAVRVTEKEDGTVQPMLGFAMGTVNSRIHELIREAQIQTALYDGPYQPSGGLFVDYYKSDGLTFRDSPQTGNHNKHGYLYHQRVLPLLDLGDREGEWRRIRVRGWIKNDWRLESYGGANYRVKEPASKSYVTLRPTAQEGNGLVAKLELGTIFKAIKSSNGYFYTEMDGWVHGKYLGNL